MAPLVLNQTASSIKTIMLVSLSASALLLSACNKPATESTTPDATSNGEEAPLNIKIATESSYKPFSYTDANGNVVGFEIDLTNALCEQMKAKCEIISQDWDGLIPGLNAKKFDGIIAGMSITPERKEVVDFTDPYFHSGIILIGKKGDNLSVEALKGIPVGSQLSTVSAQYLQDNHPEANIKLYDTQDNAYLDLTSGRVRALMVDKVIGMDWLKTDAGKDYEVKGSEITSEEDAMGIAFRKGDPLVGKFNMALNELKSSGKYAEISDKYFGTGSTAAAQTTAAKTAQTANEVENVIVVEKDDANVDANKVIAAEENAEATN